MALLDMVESNPSSELRWLLSFYRASEIDGALFFGRLARTCTAGELQSNMTQHFADESEHAALWTKALDDLGLRPDRIRFTYQTGYHEQFIEMGGLPTNMMEVLAITRAFEVRVARHYVQHRKRTTIPCVRATLDRILLDEAWHVRWVTRELRKMKREYGAEVDAAIARYRAADAAVYAKLSTRYEAALAEVLGDEGPIAAE